MQPTNLVLGTPKYQHATRGMPRLVGGVCMYIAEVGIHSFGVSFSVWFLVWCVVGLLALERGCAVLVSCPVLWHGCTLGLLTSRAKNKRLLSEDCKNITEELLHTVSKRPLGGGASRGGSQGESLAYPEDKNKENTVSSPHGSPLFSGRSP
jgi:hypothetical protein